MYPMTPKLMRRYDVHSDIGVGLVASSFALGRFCTTSLWPSLGAYGAYGAAAWELLTCQGNLGEIDGNLWKLVEIPGKPMEILGEHGGNSYGKLRKPMAPATVIAWELNLFGNLWDARKTWEIDGNSNMFLVFSGI